MHCTGTFITFAALYMLASEAAPAPIKFGGHSSGESSGESSGSSGSSSSSSTGSTIVNGITGSVASGVGGLVGGTVISQLGLRDHSNPDPPFYGYVNQAPRNPSKSLFVGDDGIGDDIEFNQARRNELEKRLHPAVVHIGGDVAAGLGGAVASAAGAQLISSLTSREELKRGAVSKPLGLGFITATPAMMKAAHAFVNKIPLSILKKAGSSGAVGTLYHADAKGNTKIAKPSTGFSLGISSQANGSEPIVQLLVNGVSGNSTIGSILLQHVPVSAAKVKTGLMDSINNGNMTTISA